jgi:hypothetical protein
MGGGVGPEKLDENAVDIVQNIAIHKTTKRIVFLRIICSFSVSALLERFELIFGLHKT